MRTRVRAIFARRGRADVPDDFQLPSLRPPLSRRSIRPWTRQSFATACRRCGAVFVQHQAPQLQRKRAKLMTLISALCALPRRRYARSGRRRSDRGQWVDGVDPPGDLRESRPPVPRQHRSTHGGWASRLCGLSCSRDGDCVRAKSHVSNSMTSIGTRADCMCAAKARSDLSCLCLRTSAKRSSRIYAMADRLAPVAVYFCGRKRPSVAFWDPAA